ncbi:MAG TPA: hypothetical protein VN806_11935 [Caulobacteraceae bacterium]|nr:hypothetical protein [Caulobacteraceae bacterium]
MRVAHILPQAPLAADGGALARTLRQAGVAKGANIRVTGPAGVTAVLWLYRHGYEGASYVHPNWAGARGYADVLLIPHSCEPEELAALLARGHGLRDGGLVIVQAAPDRGEPELDSIPTVLAARGCRVEARIAEHGREVFIARLAGIGADLKEAA